MKIFMIAMFINFALGENILFAKSLDGLSDLENTEQTHLLGVRKQFPQYFNHFDEKAVQEEVYAKTQKELNKKDVKNSKDTQP